MYYMYERIFLSIIFFYITFYFLNFSDTKTTYKAPYNLAYNYIGLLEFLKHVRTSKYKKSI